MSHEELGDQLGALARASETGEGEAREVQPEVHTADQVGQPAVTSETLADADQADDEDYITAEIEDESGVEVAQAPVFFHQPGHSPAPYPPLPRRGKSKNTELKAMAAPVLMTVGMLLLIPAFWSVLVLTGASVPMADRDDAVTMAKVMLLCWPLALTLIIPAAILFAQISAEKRRARKA